MILITNIIYLQVFVQMNLPNSILITAVVLFRSVGGSWRLTQEEFLKDVEWLSNLKLKASYGTQGNDGILDINGYVVYQPYLKQYSVTNNNGDFSVVETYRGNKDLTWEKRQKFQISVWKLLFLITV